MATRAFDYTGWKRFPRRAVLAALAAMAMTAAVVAGVIYGTGGQGHNIGDASIAAPVVAPHEPEHLTLYIVSSEAERDRVVQSENDVASIAGLDGSRPVEYVVLVAPSSDPQASQMVSDTQWFLVQNGIRLSLVDLR